MTKGIRKVPLFLSKESVVNPLICNTLYNLINNFHTRLNPFNIKKQSQEQRARLSKYLRR